MSSAPVRPTTLSRPSDDPSPPLPLPPLSQRSPHSFNAQPLLTRHGSQHTSSSESSESKPNATRSPNGSPRPSPVEGLGTSRYVPKVESDLQKGPSGSTSQFAVYHATPAPYSMPRSMGRVESEFGASQGEGLVEGTYDANGDFIQAFYDPFRVKHRRRTSPAQLKVLEYHFDRNPKPDVTLRKALSEQLEMTPREVQVWFQNRRAKMKKLRENQEKEVADDDDQDLPYEPCDDPPQTSGPYDPAYIPPQLEPHHLQPPPHLPLEFNALRRGSSPAALSSGLVAYDYDPSPFQPHDAGPTIYSATHHSSHQSYYPPHQEVYPSPMSLASAELPSPSLSPPDANGEYSQHPQRRFNALEEAGQSGRRFELPAYSSSYGPAAESAQWLPPKELADPTSRNSLSFVPQQVPFPCISPPLDVHHSSEQEFLSANSSHPPHDFGFDIPHDDGEYSPDSSPDEQAVPHDYVYSNGAYFDHGAGEIPHYEQAHGAVPLDQYSFGTRHQHSTVGSSDEGDVSLMGTSPGTSVDGFSHYSGRRASCPAGFLPTFDHLGLASPVAVYASWPNQPFQDAHFQPTFPKRHSFAAPSSGPYPPNPMQAYASPLPTYGPPTPLPNPSPPTFAFTNPQFLQSAGRRGSASSMLGTISEQARPYGETMDELVVPPGPERRLSSASTTRKVRSQSNLRGPYPSQEQRSPGGGERRGPDYQ